MGMENRVFQTDAINTSTTIAEKMGAACADIRGLSVKYDANGDVVPCNTAGEFSIGVVTINMGDETPGKIGAVAAGNSVTIQIKDCGLAKAGGTIAKGNLLSVDANGCLVKAAEAQIVVGFAHTEASAGDLFRMQICRMGKA